MKKVKNSPYLRQVFKHLILFRLFIPLMVVLLIAIIVGGYLEKKSLINHQNQVVESMSHIVEYHIDHGVRILDSVARVAETSGTENLPVFMKSVWESYGHFETLYYLNKENRITLMMPSEPSFTGIDMSNLPDFKKNEKKEQIIISRPFISLRTGVPTVYLIRPLSSGDYVVGELNLGLFQQEITNMIGRSGKDFIFIMDQSGTLLAHPSADLVKQQTNLSDLKIFHNISVGKTSSLYMYKGISVIASAARVERTGWIVVDQVSLPVLLKSYTWIVGLIVLAFVIIWLSLMLDLTKQLHRYVTTPMELLSQGTNALTAGDFNQANLLSSIPTAFAELNKLSSDFQVMSNKLQVREIAIKEQQELILKAEKERRESLEKALIMKDEFISLISHELKTPLNVIYSAIQLIEYVYLNQIPERVKELIGNIKQNTFRQLRLANNLLDITRLNSGQFKLNMKNIDIVFLTKVITESVELYSDQKNIKVSFESNVERKIISIDDEKYERIILNIISNAIKFTESEGTIKVIFNENRKSDLIEIKVKDTGIGIPKDKQELIFERFGQVDSNLSRQAEGTGIGLSLVKLLVTILGGTIEVESELGVGSTFIMTLPAKEEVIDNEIEDSLDIDDRVIREIKIEFSDIYL